MHKTTIWLGISTLTLGTLMGCSHSSSIPPPTMSAKVTTTIEPQKKTNPPLTKTQALGVDVLKALMSDTRLHQARISVGTDADTITLDGDVPSAWIRELAFHLAQQKSPGYKVVNRLVVVAPNAMQSRRK